MHVDLEPAAGSAKRGAKELPNSLTPAYRRQSYVRVLDVNGQELNCPVDVASAGKVQEPFDHERRCQIGAWLARLFCGRLGWGLSYGVSIRRPRVNA